MPVYDYKALDPQGRSKKGIIESDSQKGARQKLKKQGLMVTDIHERSSSAKKAAAGGKGGGGGGFSLFNSVKPDDLALMTRQLASLVKANIPLVEALSALVDQTEKAALKTILSEIRDDVNEGSSLARSLSKHPKVFDNIFINMVDAGEASGTLGPVLVKLADLKESQMKLRSKISSAMVYPILMVSVSVLILIGLFVFVIPKITEVFTSTGKPLPPQTAFLLSISGFLIDYWWALLAASLVFGFLSNRYIHTVNGRKKWDAFKLSLPIFGPIIRLSAVTRFAATMSTLLSSNVPILNALSIVQRLVDNMSIATAIGEARENITEGQSIAEPLRRSREFPPMVIHMIAVGEKTGELPKMLENIASTYENQVSAKVEGLTSLLSPIMMIVMGGIVAFIVGAVFLPMLDMTSGFSQ
jgi:general secretion pathway protein F